MLNTRNEENNTPFYSYFACFVNVFTLNMYSHVTYRVNQAEYVIHIFVVAPQKYVNIYSTRRPPEGLGLIPLTRLNRLGGLGGL